MAKLTRESRLRERRAEKQARKDARKQLAEHPEPSSDTLEHNDDDAAPTAAGDPVLAGVADVLADA